METIKISENDLARMQRLGEGACATVYKYNEDQVVKIFKKEQMDIINEESFFQLFGIENNTCVFPRCRVEVDGFYQGYSMQFVDGCKFIDVAKQIDLNLLIEAILTAENNIRQLAPHKILFEDDNDGGLMWTKNGEIKITDTDQFYRSSDMTEEETCNENLFHFNSLIELVTGFMSGPLYEYLNGKKEFYEIYGNYSCAYLSGKSISITILFKKAIEIFTKEFGVAPNSIEEMESILKEHNLFNPDDGLNVPDSLSLDDFLSRFGTSSQETTNVLKETPPRIKK